MKRRVWLWFLFAVGVGLAYRGLPAWVFITLSIGLVGFAWESGKLALADYASTKAAP